MTDSEHATAKRAALVNDVIVAAEVAETAGFTGEQVWTHAKTVLMDMEGISETEAMSIIQEAKTAGPGKSQ